MIPPAIMLLTVFTFARKHLKRSVQLKLFGTVHLRLAIKKP